MQAPIRSVAAAKRTRQWEGPGGWKEAPGDEIERIFIEFRGIKVVPASRRRKSIAQHGRRKVHTLRLVVPSKEKRNADGIVTWKKARIAAGVLVSIGKIPGTYFANLAGGTSR